MPEGGRSEEDEETSGCSRFDKRLFAQPHDAPAGASGVDRHFGADGRLLRTDTGVRLPGAVSNPNPFKLFSSFNVELAFCGFCRIPATHFQRKKRRFLRLLPKNFTSIDWNSGKSLNRGRRATVRRTARGAHCPHPFFFECGEKALSCNAGIYATHVVLIRQHADAFFKWNPLAVLATRMPPASV